MSALTTFDLSFYICLTLTVIAFGNSFAKNNQTRCASTWAAVRFSFLILSRRPICLRFCLIVPTFCWEHSWTLSSTHPNLVLHPWFLFEVVGLPMSCDFAKSYRQIRYGQVSLMIRLGIAQRIVRGLPLCMVPLAAIQALWPLTNSNKSS